MRFAGSQISNFMDTSNFDDISKSSMKGRAQERMYDAQATGLVDKAGIDAEGLIQRAKYGASATRAEGSAAGQSAMFGGIASGIGSLAGGFANRSTPAAPKGQPIPTNMTPLNNPSYLNPSAPSSLEEYSSLLNQW